MVADTTESLPRYLAPLPQKTETGALRYAWVKLVFIGARMDESSIADALDDCLVSETGMEEDWDAFENPFSGTMEWSQPPMEQRLVVGDLS